MTRHKPSWITQETSQPPKVAVFLTETESPCSAILSKTDNPITKKDVHTMKILIYPLHETKRKLGRGSQRFIRRLLPRGVHLPIVSLLQPEACRLVSVYLCLCACVCVLVFPPENSKFGRTINNIWCYMWKQLLLQDRIKTCCFICCGC